MPNHCYLDVNVQGPRAMAHELFFNVELKYPRFCDAVVPQPLASFSRIDQYPDGPMDWRIAHWGTKWDICDVEITEPFKMSDDETKGKFAFKGWTAWSPPVPVWDRLTELGFDISASYVDEFEMFKGAYIFGKDNCWDPKKEVA